MYRHLAKEGKQRKSTLARCTHRLAPDLPLNKANNTLQDTIAEERGVSTVGQVPDVNSGLEIAPNGLIGQAQHGLTECVDQHYTHNSSFSKATTGDSHLVACRVGINRCGRCIQIAYTRNNFFASLSAIRGSQALRFRIEETGRGEARHGSRTARCGNTDRTGDSTGNP